MKQIYGEDMNGGTSEYIRDQYTPFSAWAPDLFKNVENESNPS